MDVHTWGSMVHHSASVLQLLECDVHVYLRTLGEAVANKFSSAPLSIRPMRTQEGITEDPPNQRYSSQVNIGPAEGRSYQSGGDPKEVLYR